MKNLLGDFNAKMEKENNFKPTIWNGRHIRTVRIMI
jgi:hypothetical protein